MLIKELGLGVLLALVIFLAYRGYDVTPLLVMAIFGGVLYYVAESRGLFKSIEPLDMKNGGQETTFDDIGGQGAAIKELQEALDFIKEREKIKKLGIRPLKGILLTGPPGTGKTLMARAAASYTDAAFLAVSGSEFIEMYAGIGAQRVRKLFRSAREKARRLGKSHAIIFIDEIDVLGGRRGQYSGHMEYDQTLNQLLVEMDGIRADDEIRLLVIGATNRIDMLDPALLRPGRFDRVVRVDLPDREGRLQILKIHTRNKPLADDVNLEDVARETFGFSGAQLESVTNEAAIYAFREGAEAICARHFKEAIEKVIMGERLDRRPAEEELERIAIHETGHALVSELLRPGSVTVLTITPRGSALGYMRQAPADDPYLYTREYIENQIAIMVAGAVAEEVILGGRSTGAANDFNQAVAAARKLIFSGLSSLGVVDEESLPDGPLHREISRIIKTQEERVVYFITEYREKIIQASEKLLEKERLSGDDFRQLVFADGRDHLQWACM